MADAGEAGVPQSPEVQPPEVRDQLDQSMVTHDGTERDADDGDPGTAAHMGAVDTEVTPVMAPISGPHDLVNEEDTDDNMVDPYDEITPG